MGVERVMLCTSLAIPMAQEISIPAASTHPEIEFRLPPRELQAVSSAMRQAERTRKL
jgi:hypothetical protein